MSLKQRDTCMFCGAPAANGQAAFVSASGSTSRLDDAIENAKRKAVKELNMLDYHEGDLRKWNIVERAIRSVIAEMSNADIRRAQPDSAQPKP